MPPAARFADIGFSVPPVLKLTPALAETLGQGFRCKRGEFVTFWRCGRIARKEQAHIALLADKLELEQPPLAGEGVKYRTLPAVKIGLPAADGRGKGAGRRLVEWALEYVATELVEKVGVRFSMADAFHDLDPDSHGVLYDASGFYTRIGFNFVNPGETLPPPQS